MMENEEGTPYEDLGGFPIYTKKGWILFGAWIILFLVGFIPWGFLYDPEPYIGGWLPFPLAFFWVLEAIYVVFVAYVSYDWMKSERAARMRRERKEESGGER